MLQLTIGGEEVFDEAQMRFLTKPSKVVRLEHSLKAISKWESKWKRAFLSKKPMTKEENIDYIRCMEVTGQVDPSIFDQMTRAQQEQIAEYINDKMTATVINRRGPNKPSRETITSEVIYFWMIQYGIPPEYDKWHLNRLLTLIEVCGVKGGPQKKMSMKEQLAEQRAINEARKAKYKTRG